MMNNRTNRGITYDYESFEKAYNKDSRISNITSNFNGKGIVIDPEDNELDSEDTQDPEDNEDGVEDMAKSATDLTDELS